MTRSKTRLAGGVLAVALVFAACGGDDSDDGVITIPNGSAARQADPPEDRDQDSPDNDSEETDGSGSDAPAADVVIEVDHVAGQITGGGRHTVATGSTVVVLVFSDVDEELHLHGYDLVVDVVAGDVVELRFVADLPGVWELELHGSHRRVLELAVS